MPLSRFSDSLESDLLEALDKFIETNNFPNRSQAVRQLIEHNLVEEKWQCNNLVAGAVILVYDCHKRDIAKKLSEIQQAYREEILSVQRFQISQGTNFDIVAVRGKSYRLTFAVLDAKVSFHPLSWLGFFVKGENLTGRDYQILYGYPMPGVTVFGRINVSLR